MTEFGDSEMEVGAVLMAELNKNSHFLSILRAVDRVPLTRWQVFRYKVRELARRELWQRLHDFSSSRGADCYYDD